jgi:hypothetical protein
MNIKSKRKSTRWFAEWSIAMAMCLASLGWFADFLRASDLQYKAYDVAMNAAVMGAKAFKFESSSPFLMKHHSQVALVKLLREERHAAFDARDFRIVVDPAAQTVLVAIDTASPNKFLKFVGFENWVIQGSSSARANYSGRIELPGA